MLETLLQYTWMFLLYGFLGWCTEVVFAAVNEGKFVNRGFLNGPICPIYGFGMVIVVAVLGPVANQPVLLYIGSVLLTSALEFITGFLLEKLFHEKWWDYSEEPFHIQGYVCLKFSLLWGIGCLLVMNVVHKRFLLPLVTWLTGHLLGHLLLAALLVYMVIDVTLTVIALTKLKERLTRLEAAEAELRRLSDGIGEGLYRSTERAIRAKEKVQPQLDRHRAQLQNRKEQIQQHRAKIQEIRREKESPSLRRLYAAFPRMKARIHQNESIPSPTGGAPDPEEKPKLS